MHSDGRESVCVCFKILAKKLFIEASTFSQASLANALSRCARTRSHTMPSIPFATGTRSTAPYTLSIAFTSAGVAHFACDTKSCLRPGMTNAHVTMRASPLSTPRLHSLHFARLVGASPIEYVLGCVLNPVARPMYPGTPPRRMPHRNPLFHLFSLAYILSR